MGSEAAQTNVRLCPACGYDVASLLAQGIGVCPECGGAISDEACRPRVRRHPLRPYIRPVLFGILVGLPPAAPAAVFFGFGWQWLSATVLCIGWVLFVRYETRQQNTEVTKTHPSGGTFPIRVVKGIEILIGFVLILGVIAFVSRG